MVFEGGGDSQFPYPQTFLSFLSTLLGVLTSVLSSGSAYSKALPTPSGADWWASLAVARKEHACCQNMFRWIHKTVRAVLSLFQRWTEVQSSFILLIFSALGIVASRRVESGGLPLCVIMECVLGWARRSHSGLGGFAW